MVNIWLLLGVSLLILHVAAVEEPIVSLWPKSSEIYLGESVLLQCRVKSNSTFGWTYHWNRTKAHAALTPNPRHMVSGDSYSIMAVTMEDEGRYWCKAEQRGSNTTIKGWVMLKVSELTPPSIALTPSSRQVFSGECFTVHCPATQNNSKGLKLRHFSPGKSFRIKQRKRFSTAGGAVGAKDSEKCLFRADQESSGLYWCEGGRDRSISVNITVSYGDIILRIPAFPVFEGDKVVLNCQHRTGNHHEAMLFKDGTPVSHSNSSWTITAVTTKDEGFYKCVSRDGKMESPQGWLSVMQQGNFTLKDGKETSTNDASRWIVALCCVLLLFLIPLIWLIKRNRYRMFGIWSCWPLSKENIPAVPAPVTKQDVTEVQWDLSWMEMSNLLDKQLYPGT